MPIANIRSVADDASAGSRGMVVRVVVPVTVTMAAVVRRVVHGWVVPLRRGVARTVVVVRVIRHARRVRRLGVRRALPAQLPLPRRPTRAAARRLRIDRRRAESRGARARVA